MDLYRHLLHFAGGQGIIIVVLSLFAAGGGAHRHALRLRGARRTHPAELHPHLAVHLPRRGHLRRASAPPRCSSPCSSAGFTPARAIYHAVNLFLGAFDTGGFSTDAGLGRPTTTRPSVEAVVMRADAGRARSRFGLHFQLWHGDPRQVLRHIETRTLAVSTSVLFAVVCFGLLRSRHLRRAGAAAAQGPVHAGGRHVQRRLPGQRRRHLPQRLGCAGPGRHRRGDGHRRYGVVDGRRHQGDARRHRRQDPAPRRQEAAAARVRAGGDHLPRRQAADPARQHRPRRDLGAAAVRRHLPDRRGRGARPTAATTSPRPCSSRCRRPPTSVCRSASPIRPCRAG